MIEGLKYHFTSNELSEHMKKRAMYHTQRAAEKEAALPSMRDALKKVREHAPAQNVAQMSKFSNNSGYQIGNPDKDLEADIKEHRNKALVFNVLADHVVKDETYVLGESDLRRLEILKEAWA